MLPPRRGQSGSARPATGPLPVLGRCRDGSEGRSQTAQPCRRALHPVHADSPSREGLQRGDEPPRALSGWWPRTCGSKRSWSARASGAACMSYPSTPMRQSVGESTDSRCSTNSRRSWSPCITVPASRTPSGCACRSCAGATTGATLRGRSSMSPAGSSAGRPATRSEPNGPKITFLHILTDTTSSG